MITHLTRERWDELVRLVEEDSDPEGRWLVMTHDNPDPDSLAAAAILARVLVHRFGRKTTCAYGGIIGRAENREMVSTLGLKLSHVRHLSWKNYAHFALVDTQPGTGNNQLPREIAPDVVVDHHPPRRPTQRARFADVRTDYGATATIAAEYLALSEAGMTRALATATVYAIRSETLDFRREPAGPDKALYDELLPQADKRALAKIQNAPLPVEYFRNLHAALESLETIETLIVSHLGTVEHPDIVPEIADLLLRMEGKTWSLCTGVYGERVYLSIRTTNVRADAGRLMRRLLGPNGKGGGHGMLAGGWVAITPGYADDPRSLQRLLARRLAKALRKSPDRLENLDLEAASKGPR